MILLQKWVVTMAMVIYGLSRVQRCLGDDGEMLLSPYHMRYIDLLMITVVFGGCYQLHLDFLEYMNRKRVPVVVEAGKTVNGCCISNIKNKRAWRLTFTFQ